MVLTDSDTLNLTTLLEMPSQLCLICPVVDILDEDTALVTIICSSSKLTVLTCIVVGAWYLTFLFFAYYKAQKLVNGKDDVILTLFELLLELLKLLLLLRQFLLIDG